jgi:hypothetical protein
MDSAVKSIANNAQVRNSSASEKAPAPSDSVALRAGRRYEERGREDGGHVNDWLEAQRSLANNKAELGAFASSSTP